MTANNSGELEKGVDDLKLSLDTNILSRLLQYLRLLVKWNRVYNLTAIREDRKLVSHHLLDSLAVMPYLVSTSLVDVGSGAGLPGVPLAIANPSLRVVLLDSNHKKAAFLRQVAVELKLDNIEIVTDRSQQWRPAERLDQVVSRAFSDLPGFVDAALHLCAPDGRLLAMKGVFPHEEIEQLPAGVRLQSVIPLAVPGLNAVRHLVVLQPSV
ncbi:MAG: 16S rRNA (guanine(527)-N(7))-methyltransferase RsmG [Betaproteobacteria bacterium]